MITFLNKQFNRIKKLLPIIKYPTLTALFTGFLLKIGYFINLTYSWFSSSGIAEKAGEILATAMSWLVEKGITAKAYEICTKITSSLPDNFIAQAGAFGKGLWINTTHYLRTNISNQTTVLISGIVFLGTTLLVAANKARESFKNTAFDGYLFRLRNEQKNPDTQPFTEDEIAIFNMGKDAANSLLSRFKSCFNKTAIVNPTAYYAGLKFASSSREECLNESIICFSELINKKEAFSNKVKEYKLLSQEKRDQALYAFEEVGNFAQKLTREQLQQAKALLIAGANPNYIPPQNEYRMPFIEPSSLISSAINSADLDFFNLLLRYDANIFQESKSSNPVIWEAFARACLTHPSNVQPEYTAMINKIVEMFGITIEEINANLTRETNINQISFSRFVEQIKAKSSVASLKA